MQLTRMASGMDEDQLQIEREFEGCLLCRESKKMPARLRSNRDKNAQGR